MTGLATAEVTIASLDPLPVAGSVVAMDPGPQEGLGAIVRLMPEAQAKVPDRIDATHPAPIEAIVASLAPSRDLSDVAPDQGQPASVATTGLIAPEVALSDLDPLDAFEDDAPARPRRSARVRRACRLRGRADRPAAAAAKRAAEL